MNDLISRQAAIDALDKVAEMFPYRIPGKPKTYRQYNEAWGDAVDAAENAIEAMPFAQPEQRWIPCSEQEYPSDNREVEVTCEVRRLDGKIYQYTCHASYVHRYSIESTDYCNWEECDEYNKEEDKYYALPGWYERVHNWDDYSYCAIEDRVVAWRELSEPWRGEEHD